MPQKSTIPKNFTDNADEWRSWQEGVADYADTMTPGMKKVLAEVDQEADVIDGLWRDARETKYGKVMEEHTNLWRLLRRITEGESKKVATSQEPLRNCCIVDRDGPRDEVGGQSDRGGSQRDARAVSTGGDPGSCDPPTHRHEPFEVILKKIAQDFANNSTTSQGAMQIGRDGAGATAPTTAWPPSVAETLGGSWEECGAINAMGAQQCWTCKGYGHVSRDCPNVKGKGKDNFGKGTYQWQEQQRRNKGSNYGMYKGG